MENRHKSRITALEILYSFDVKEELEVLSQPVLNKIKIDLQRDISSFSEELILGIVKELNKIDTLIESTSSNWKVSRMSFIDRNILRIGVYELLTSNPKPVVINEAILLASEFGSENSSSFINGILDNLKI